jgi:hypothetical protein
VRLRITVPEVNLGILASIHSFLALHYKPDMITPKILVICINLDNVTKEDYAILLESFNNGQEF